MNRETSWRVMIGLLIVAMMVGVGVYGYNAGVARGLAEGSRVAAAPGTGVSVVPMWPRPWGFGYGFFPFFPVFPFFFLLFWFFVARGLFWRGGWRRGCGYDGVPPSFDEWH